MRSKDINMLFTGRMGVSERGISRHVNSVSYIDRAARIFFPASFGLLNLCYWLVYVTWQEDFKWDDPPMTTVNH